MHILYAVAPSPASDSYLIAEENAALDDSPLSQLQRQMMDVLETKAEVTSSFHTCTLNMFRQPRLQQLLMRAKHSSAL